MTEEDDVEGIEVEENLTKDEEEEEEDELL